MNIEYGTPTGSIITDELFPQMDIAYGTPTRGRIITNELFPQMYLLNTSDVIIDEGTQLYPDVYLTYGLPSTLRPSIDPRFVTGPQLYEYKYTNENGINVVLRGTYNQVMSIVDVLEVYPPNLREDTKPGELFDIYGKGSRQAKITKNIPEVGVERRAGYLLVRMKEDGKVYSGAGSLIMVIEDGNRNNAKIVLFKDSYENTFSEAGGRIDELRRGETVTKKILFTTAQKETEEESRKLFSLKEESPVYVDIKSSSDETSYRVFVYMFTMKNINDLKTRYNDNMSKIKQYPSSSSYNETDRLELFDYNTFVPAMQSLGTGSSGEIYASPVGSVRISARTIKLFKKLKDDKVFDDIISGRKLSVQQPSVTTDSNGMTTIAL